MVSPRLLEDRVAIVTGGAGGIGEGIADAFADHGARVVIADIDAGRTAVVVDRLQASGVGALGVVVDVTEPGATDRVMAEAVEWAGGIDIVVNNVGHYLGGGGRFHETDEASWDELDAVNLRHVLRMCRSAIPALIERGGGSIINLTTVEAHRGIPHQAAYGAYKAAVEHFTRCLALDVSADGIRVNSIAPDVTQSIQLPYDRWLSEEDVERIARWVPLGRLGTAADCGGVAVFLASDLSAFVTGASIPVDGGTGVAGGWYRTEHGRAGWTNRPLDA